MGVGGALHHHRRYYRSAEFLIPAKEQTDHLIGGNCPDYAAEGKPWTVNVHDFVALNTNEYIDSEGRYGGQDKKEVLDAGESRIFETAQVLTFFEDTKVSHSW
jgi:hypothetical protein